MELEEKAEEVLETLWIHTKEGEKTSVSLNELEVADRESIDQLLKEGYISLEKDEIRLTNEGQPLARNVVRRHRLAERLLADVLSAGDRLMHERACKFEHSLDRGLEESICSLLGHPKVCPHGKPIPPGRCCQQEQKQGQKVVSTLSQLTPGQTSKVAYIYAPKSNQLQKLTAMGILPGAPLTLLQNFPSYVFQVRQTQFVVDKEIADTIYVRLVSSETAEETEEERQRSHRGQKGRLARRLGLK